MIRQFTLFIITIILFGSCREMRNADGESTSRPSPLKTTEGKVGDAIIKLTYSSPGVKNRPIWGELVPYDKIWRTGANDATIIETSSDLVIAGTTVKRGKYSLFTIPGKDEWVIIINKVWDQWGAYNYDETLDAVRVSVKPVSTDSLYERMQFSVEKSGIVKFNWEKLTWDFLIEPI